MLSLFDCRSFGSLSSHNKYLNYQKQNKNIKKLINYESNVNENKFQNKTKQIFEQTLATERAETSTIK